MPKTTLCSSMSPVPALEFLVRVYFSKFSSGLQGHILKRGKITEKVIREKNQVIVKSPEAHARAPLSEDLRQCQQRIRREPSQSSPQRFKDTASLHSFLSCAWSRAWQRISSKTMRFLTSLQRKVRSCPRSKCSFKISGVRSELEGRVSQARTSEASPEGWGRRCWSHLGSACSNI